MKPQYGRGEMDDMHLVSVLLALSHAKFIVNPTVRIISEEIVSLEEYVP